MALIQQTMPFVLLALLLSGGTARASQDTVWQKAASQDPVSQNIASAGRPAASEGGKPVSGGASATPQQTSSQFVLGAADIIRVNVWKNPDLSQSATVGPDGFVSLPLLGDVHVAGMTANQLGKTLAQKLTTYMVNPQVTVSLIDIRSRQVFVLGQVAKPGGYPLIAAISVLQLIAEAGGLGTYANTKKIFILRGGESANSKINFNYTAVLHGDSKQDIPLQPGDTVVVP